MWSFVSVLLLYSAVHVKVRWCSWELKYFFMYFAILFIGGFMIIYGSFQNMIHKTKTWLIQIKIILINRSNDVLLFNTGYKCCYMCSCTMMTKDRPSHYTINATECPGRWNINIIIISIILTSKVINIGTSWGWAGPSSGSSWIACWD